MPTDNDFTIDRLKLALQLARSGLWQRDLRTNKIMRTPMVENLHKAVQALRAQT